MSNQRRVEMFLYPALFLTGGVIMAVEILGARMIHPYFGVSIYVWAAMIAVTLFSLASGYWLGGYFSDRYPDARHLFEFLLLAAIWIALTPSLAAPVMIWANQYELRLAALFSSFILFSLPLIFLAMMSPYAVKICIKELSQTGATAGRLYAVSTLGSLFGTLLTGFYLIPSFSGRFNFMMISLCLFGISLAGLFLFGARRRGILWGVLFFSIFYTVFFIPQSRANSPGYTVLHREDTPYGLIKVVDVKDLRGLMVNGSVQNYFRKGKDPYDFFDGVRYQTLFVSTLMVRPEIHNTLLIGLGAGQIPGYLSRLDVRTDVIEIDPAMKEIAETYFGFKEHLGDLIFGDGRYLMKKLFAEGMRYDAVLLDAFSNYDLPEHFFTQEMLQEVKSLLLDGGIVAINIGGSLTGDTSEVPKAIFTTLKSVFTHVKTFHINAVDRVNNIVFYASDAALNWNDEHCRLMDCESQKQWTDLFEERIINDRLEEGVLLTDDYNPLPVLGVPIYKTYRNRIFEYFGDEVMAEL